jgi:hypothetical protein
MVLEPEDRFMEDLGNETLVEPESGALRKGVDEVVGVSAP